MHLALGSWSPRTTCSASSDMPAPLLEMLRQKPGKARVGWLTSVASENYLRVGSAHRTQVHFWRLSAEIAQVWPTPGQPRATISRNRVKSGRARPHLDESGQTSAESGPSSVELVQIWSIPGKILPTRANFGRNWPEFGRTRPSLVESVPKFGRTRTNVGRNRSDLVDTGLHRAKFGCLRRCSIHGMANKGSRRIASAAKAGARKTDYRPNPILWRTFDTHSRHPVESYTPATPNLRSSLLKRPGATSVALPGVGQTE